MSGDGMFLLSLSGQLEYVDITVAAGNLWHCKYEIIFGPDWKTISGIEAGVTQTANVRGNGNKIVFNFPIEIVLKSTNPSGWPQIIVSVFSDTIIQGYGRIHIPFQPGLHKLKLPLTKPVPSTYLGYLISFFGFQPELAEPNVVSSAEGINLIRMSSNGHTSISMNILTKGMQTLGYDCGR